MKPPMNMGMDQSSAPSSAPPPIAGAQPAQQGGSVSVRQASPEEQQLYNQFVGLSMILLYDKKFMQRAIEMIRAEQTVMEGVAKVAALVAYRVYEDGQKKGKEIPASVVVHAGMEVIQLVSEMAMAAGFEPMNEQETELAYYGAADKFRDLMEKSGMIDPAQLDADRAEIEQMQQDGRLASVMAEIQAAQGQSARPQMPKGMG